MELVQDYGSGECVAVRILEKRIRAIEDCLKIGGQGPGLSTDVGHEVSAKCGSSMGKAELVHLFFMLMDEGVWFFDAVDKKTNRNRFQDFISRNFTYCGEGGRQHRISGVSRHFSECTGFSYREKQILQLNKMIALLTSRKERIERG